MTDQTTLAALLADELRATAKRYRMAPGTDAIDYFPDADVWATRIAARLITAGVTLAPTPPEVTDTTPVVMDDYMAGYRQAQSDAAGLREAAQDTMDWLEENADRIEIGLNCDMLVALRAALAGNEQP